MPFEEVNSTTGRDSGEGTDDLGTGFMGCDGGAEVEYPVLEQGMEYTGLISVGLITACLSSGIGRVLNVKEMVDEETETGADDSTREPSDSVTKMTEGWGGGDVGKNSLQLVIT
eukprot:CAMPEP_0115038672 /NCGR_PEP_ID=MMETSP0216-20121206/43553_1 /TAXON_ID=223996 /ORGANISM="Protocruzia adherens, Strain Boccale" /LENGTH=113 /DNA_ID=CAMNT_0002419127 /DNA_START=277 /DNA_END=618 /DNA_ORIENTATION=-